MAPSASDTAPAAGAGAGRVAAADGADIAAAPAAPDRGRRARRGSGPAGSAATCHQTLPAPPRRLRAGARAEFPSLLQTGPSTPAVHCKRMLLCVSRTAAAIDVHFPGACLVGRTPSRRTTRSRQLGRPYKHDAHAGSAVSEGHQFYAVPVLRSPPCLLRTCEPHFLLLVQFSCSTLPLPPQCLR
jgi:hypothetical protein